MSSQLPYDLRVRKNSTSCEKMSDLNMSSPEVQECLKKLSSDKSKNKEIAIVLQALANSQAQVMELLEEKQDFSNTINLLEGRITRLECEAESLKNKNTFLEFKMMENNVILQNIAEVEKENVLEVVKDFIKNNLKHEEDVTIDLAHRFGQATEKNPRQILVRFVHKSHAKDILSKGKMLEKSKYKMFPQIPQDLRASQKLLNEERKRLKDLPENKEVKISVQVQNERLIVGGKTRIDMKAARNTKSPNTEQRFSDVVKTLSGKVQSTGSKKVLSSTFRAHHVPIRHLSEIRPALALINAANGVGGTISGLPASATRR